MNPLFETLLSIPSHGGGVCGWLARIAARNAAAEARRREARQLAEMPDYRLHDIGLTRDGATSLAHRLRSGSTS